MIEFVTLFLGLVTGPQNVQVLADQSVAAVEILLDGAAVGRIENKPWRLQVDFGPRLLPRELVAIAYDTEGRELDRTAQQINRPRPAAEARLVLERNADGRPIATRVAWESTAGRRPLATRALLDGEVLPVTDPERIVLPGHLDDRLHFVQVELEFASGVTARAELGFGGQNPDQVSIELTALPVVLPARTRTPSPSEMNGWFERGGRPLRVVAIEEGEAEWILVRASGMREAVQELDGVGPSALGSGAIGSATGMISISQGASAVASSEERMRRALTLPPDHHLRVLLPIARPVTHRYLALELFAASPEISREEGGLFWALTQRVQLEGAQPRERLADAVAVAGLRAAAGNRRRAVVLTIGPEARDESSMSPRVVRDYLAAIGVPLHIWALGDVPASFDTWPPPRRLASLRDLRNAVRDLERSLGRQRIVWLEGSHPPEAISLSAAAKAENIVP